MQDVTAASINLVLKKTHKKNALFFYFPITFQSVSVFTVAGETEKKMLKKCSRKANFRSGILTAQVMTALVRVACVCMLSNDCSSGIICPLGFLQIVCLNVPVN